MRKGKRSKEEKEKKQETERRKRERGGGMEMRKKGGIEGKERIMGKRKGKV